MQHEKFIDLAFKTILEDVTYIERLCEVHGKVSYKYDLLIAYLRMLILEVVDVGLDGAQTRKSSRISATRQHTTKCCPISCLVCHLVALIADEDTNVTSHKFPIQLFQISRTV